MQSPTIKPNEKIEIVSSFSEIPTYRWKKKEKEKEKIYPTLLHIYPTLICHTQKRSFANKRILVELLLD